MVKIDVEDWLNDETENASIAMWQAKPVLYDVTCKGYSNRNQRVAAILGSGLRHAMVARCWAKEEYLRRMQDWIQRHPRSRFRRWNVDDINITMLKKYIGLCINMGLVRKKTKRTKEVRPVWSLL